MIYTYKTKGGVCSASIRVEMENGIVKDVKFSGGCNGNGQGVAKLAAGMPAVDVIKRLRHIKCGMKQSSCPDQLAIALEEALKKNEKTAED